MTGQVRDLVLQRLPALSDEQRSAAQKTAALTTAVVERRRSAMATSASQSASPWLNTQEACEYLRFTGKDRLNSLYRFLDANGIPRHYRSPKRLLIARRDLDEALLGPGTARRRNRMKVA